MSLLPAEELAVDAFFNEQRLPPEHANDSDDMFLANCLRISMEASAMQRRYAMMVDKLKIWKKSDKSDVSEADPAIEEQVKLALHVRFPHIGFDGEETGKEGEEKSSKFACDPIDGTTSFFYAEGRSGFTLGHIAEDDVPLGIVANTAAGEIAYAFQDRTTRLIQLGHRRGETQARDLPMKNIFEKPVSVLSQISRFNEGANDRLHSAWRAKDIRLQRLLGSPAVGLLDAAKGMSSHVLQWMGGGRGTEPYDLAPAMKLVTNAGGIILVTKPGEKKKPCNKDDMRVLDVTCLLESIPDEGMIIASERSEHAQKIHEILCKA